MKPVLWEYGFLGVLAAGVLALSILIVSAVEYTSIITLCLFAGIWFGIRAWHDRAFYLVCAGLPLILACGSINLWAGLFVIWIIAGISCNAMGIFKETSEIRLFVLFCGVTVLVAVLVQVSNHVVVPLILLSIILAIILAIQAIRDFKFRKQYRGVRP